MNNENTPLARARTVLKELIAESGPNIWKPLLDARMRAGGIDPEWAQVNLEAIYTDEPFDPAILERALLNTDSAPSDEPVEIEVKLDAAAPIEAAPAPELGIDDLILALWAIAEQPNLPETYNAPLNTLSEFLSESAVFKGAPIPDAADLKALATLRQLIGTAEPNATYIDHIGAYIEKLCNPKTPAPPEP